MHDHPARDRKNSAASNPSDTLSTTASGRTKTPAYRTRKQSRSVQPPHVESLLGLFADEQETVTRCTYSVQFPYSRNPTACPSISRNTYFFLLPLVGLNPHCCGIQSESVLQAQFVEAQMVFRTRSGRPVKAAVKNIDRHVVDARLPP